MGIFSLLLKFQQIVSELAWEAELQFGLVAQITQSLYGQGFFFFLNLLMGLPCWSSGWDAELPKQGAQA